MWDGKERRKNNRDTQDLTKAILTANANFTGYHKDIKYLKEGIDTIKTDVKEHCQELKDLNNKVDTLPCNGHLEKIKGLGKTVDWNKKWIYGIVITIGLGGILTSLFLWGPRLLAAIK